MVFPVASAAIFAVLISFGFASIVDGKILCARRRRIAKPLAVDQDAALIVVTNIVQLARDIALTEQIFFPFRCGRGLAILPISGADDVDGRGAPCNGYHGGGPPRKQCRDYDGQAKIGLSIPRSEISILEDRVLGLWRGRPRNSAGLELAPIAATLFDQSEDSTPITNTAPKPAITNLNGSVI